MAARLTRADNVILSFEINSNCRFCGQDTGRAPSAWLVCRACRPRAIRERIEGLRVDQVDDAVFEYQATFQIDYVAPSLISSTPTDAPSELADFLVTQIPHARRRDP